MGVNADVVAVLRDRAIDGAQIFFVTSETLHGMGIVHPATQSMVMHAIGFLKAGRSPVDLPPPAYPQ
ncbi:hypothetical protein HDU96_008547 [Phlyctochytrium bullatum]|nr:hypothetical protein HDU96_008547 [Phlyctochytrium bullatum]